MNKIAKLRKECDKLYQTALLKKNKTCFGCGRRAEVIHHFIPKSLSAFLRYDEMNGTPLCNSCHFSHHSKYDPAILLKVREKMGEERVKYLLDHRKTEERRKGQVGYYEEIKQWLTT
jgi:5-methylcytosine-specific restriction endonuclease McrA